MLKFIHAADFHLDAPFTALSGEEARRRREEQRLLPGRLARLREAEGADLVLLAGDLFDGERVYRETLTALAAALEQMAAPVFIAPGNHDFYGPRTPYAAIDWPKNVHIFTAGDIEGVELPRLGCTVYGAAFTAPTCDESPLKGFAAPAGGGTPIMVLHGDVEGKSRYGNLTAEDIAASGLTYLALGHVHTCSGLRRAGSTAWAYPGCPEGRGFDELGDKGALVGTIDEQGAVDVRFVPLAQRRYQIYSVDLTGQADPAAALEAALPKGGENDLVRILLTGERGIDTLDLEALEAVAAPHFSGVTLRDMTRLRQDLWERAGEDTLTGFFLREMRRRLDGAEDDAQRVRVERAARYGLAALEGREEVGA